MLCIKMTKFTLEPFSPPINNVRFFSQQFLNVKDSQPMCYQSAVESYVLELYLQLRVRELLCCGKLDDSGCPMENYSHSSNKARESSFIIKPSVSR